MPEFELGKPSSKWSARTEYNKASAIGEAEIMIQIRWQHVNEYIYIVATVSLTYLNSSLAVVGKPESMPSSSGSNYARQSRIRSVGETNM
jgi:hypothetical protein